MDLHVHPLGCYLPQHRLLFRPRQKETNDRNCDPSLQHAAYFFEEIASSPFDCARLELCSGHGHWITTTAQQNPDVLWIAVEMKLSRAIKILTKAGHLGLQNLWVVCAQGQWLCDELLQFNAKQASSGARPISFQQVDIHFPDPWPKDRHAHHRLLQASFLKQLAALMSDRAMIHLVTDDLPTCQRLQELSKSLDQYFSEQVQIKTLNQQYGDSYFENLWRRLQRSIYSIALKTTSKNNEK